MHPDLGGFDSDTLQATSVVIKSNTSESAGGLPHASTLSTSDQEQNSILEESSVSTNSGMYFPQNLSWQVGFNIRKMTTCLIGLMCLIMADFSLSLIWGLIWSHIEHFVWFYEMLHQTVNKIAVKTLLRHFQTVSSLYDFWLCTLDAFMAFWQMPTTKHS